MYQQVAPNDAVDYHRAWECEESVLDSVRKHNSYYITRLTCQPKSIIWVKKDDCTTQVPVQQ
jgi:hypothetical protein